MSSSEKEIIKHFLEKTKKRLAVLEAKQTLTRAEVFEKDACKGDIKRAEKALSEDKKLP
ncbi:hypothetical protein [Bdellovibrio sp. BCCA]|uniref:hypothetical protein n=1 Tax=Bdellovibrio sp. BCCA TaxID=3136281 RepID=UPI0030F1B322